MSLPGMRLRIVDPSRILPTVSTLTCRISFNFTLGYSDHLVRMTNMNILVILPSGPLFDICRPFIRGERNSPKPPNATTALQLNLILFLLSVIHL
jgi:uncharacterized membrane protein